MTYLQSHRKNGEFYLLDYNNDTIEETSFLKTVNCQNQTSTTISKAKKLSEYVISLKDDG